MQVEVELRLPGVGAAAIQQVYAVRAELGDNSLGYALRRHRDGGEVVGGYVEQIPAVPLRDHQKMSV
ncbi:Uncharacterised protein [Mycobacteroides abscessus subsp. abscessus]|nr:Uncharacterised protein [Mycobacteroides abscessus subsp. abscessus]SLE72004.1 Uncharacterised protein [Mycobacteroides abscessus subsp. massiliense]